MFIKTQKNYFIKFFVTIFFSVLIVLSGGGKNINSLENRYNLKSEYNLLNLKNPVDNSSKILKYVQRSLRTFSGCKGNVKRQFNFW